ncbi:MULTISPECIES: lipopolysaccharide biosynthesis protein [unclassified Actinomyces]|uniref:lipopolysaccharide biosynthesis protein n=1 Tax=unclassified Actinomyces TaxID=2609248 RepID=UPI0020180B7A|nr:MULTISPECIES: lipopolysaccharide biosynthesis protein [unclassified Actinomyces]MCL3777005.1 lipopolysaccharide biosynthesis protein [Actinomyces sp. AC-20-1]MCL3789060.1 lipopolysaccharide biosynthesis protein [Actinomyces sp. 187325]MCL3791426.1 lipopolysaccharide biosynthesis protein [Actinomyces sp. 186855]MCL3794044.1 lipopolysaccharide biosynthesis protein [Actinomyces sp. 217892]
MPEQAPTRDGAGQLRRDYVWNTAASLLTSLSTVLMLAVVTRAAGVAAGGVYSLALAVGQQFQTLGMFEVRTFHITDVRRQFSFGTYLAARVLTVTLMIGGILGYASFAHQSASPWWLVALIALLRVFDAVEDVYYNELQRSGRLDLGGRASCIRTVVTTATFCLVLLIDGDLLTATLATLLTSTAALLGAYLPVCRPLFPLSPRWSPAPVLHVLRACLPLFLSSFLAMYLSNAPRYAIDSILSSHEQGIFAILYMPAVAINLLSLFIYRPMVTRMATQWTAGDVSGFRQAVLKGLAGTAGALVVVAAVSAWAGPWVLQLVFGEDVSAYLVELMVLVCAGGLNAAGVILFYALTTVRRQVLVLVGYAVAGITAFLLCPVLVGQHGLLGAALAYLVSLATLVSALLLPLVLHRPLSRPARTEGS